MSEPLEEAAHGFFFLMAPRTLRRCYGHGVLSILSMNCRYVYSVKQSAEAHCFYTTGRNSGCFVLVCFIVGGEYNALVTGTARA